MNVGLFFGSFNPIHTGHLIIANWVLNETDIDKIWLVISPQNPFKSDQDLLSEVHRLMLVKEAILGDDRMAASDVEFELPKPSYTFRTLSLLREKYPANTFSIVLGSDSFQDLAKWKNFESIVSNHKIVIFKRPGTDVKNKIDAQIEILNAPLLDISSTKIRELIKNKKSIRYLVPDKVREEIETKQYYKK
jgi:nicotinate-nucleotide adenylyltransferase